MTDIKKPITILHAEITESISDLKFGISELSIFQDQLNEIAEKNTKDEVSKQVEHFQNQLIRQNEISQELLHDLHVVDRQLAEDAHGDKDSDLISEKENESVKDRVETYNKLLVELKNEFHLFLEKYF
jgi:N-methylhydantoinase B/oxoprolinase/acetone carboxylase alpha subunit